jgi:predicted deacetylase
VIISLHDVSPRTLAACQRLRDELGRVGVARATLLAIPLHHGGPPLWQDADTVRWLRARVAAGDEVAQHGHLHLARRTPLRLGDCVRAAVLSRGEGECVTLHPDERAHMLGPVRRRLEDVLGIAIGGFVAPAWLAPPDLEPALAAAGFAWHESRNGLRDLRTGRRLRAPVLTFAGGSRARVAASRAFVSIASRWTERAALVRVALHPCDAGDPAVRAQALAIAERLTRRHGVSTTAAAVASSDSRDVTARPRPPARSPARAPVATEPIGR